MKRLSFIIILLVTLVIALLVVFLFKSKDSEEILNSTQNKLEVKETKEKIITICAFRDHSIEVALALLHQSDFEERNGFKVEAILLEYAPMQRTHELELSKKNAKYDLVSIDQPSLGKYVTRGWVHTINEFIDDKNLPSIDAEDIIPVLYEACGLWKEKIYALPVGSYGSLLAYRTDILEKSGFSIPKTFSDFKKYARTVNNPPKIYGTALFAHYGEYLSADVAPYLWSWGSGFINGCDINIENRPKYRVAWDNDEGIAALEFYASLYNDKLVPENTLNFDHARYIDAFQRGVVAIGIMPAEGIGSPMEDKSHSKVSGLIKYANLPGRKMANGQISAPRPGLGAHSLAIAKNSKYPVEAFLVLQYLTSKNIGRDYILNGGRPFRRSHFFKEAIKKFPYMKAMKDGIKTGRCRPNIAEYPKVSRIFYTAFHSALKHGASVAEVMREAAKKANREVLIPAYPEK